jgi:hypothetical protein
MGFFEKIITYIFLFVVFFPFFFALSLLLGYFIFDSWYLIESAMFSALLTSVLLLGSQIEGI